MINVHTYGLDIPLYLSGFRGFGYEIFSVREGIPLERPLAVEITLHVGWTTLFAFIKQQLFTMLKAPFLYMEVFYSSYFVILK